jgi:leader peptidase (prepilin peptidase) / N-methyltransferase
MLLGDLPGALLVSVAVALGLLFGSFLNVVIYRLPRGQNIAFPPSTCPACGARIAPYDNLPLLSWLLLRGKARCCGATISPRYPAVELLGGLLAWAIVTLKVQTLPASTELYLAGLQFVLYLTLGLGLLAALFIDLEHLILPDEITLGGAALGLLTVPLRDLSFSDALLGGAVGFLVVYLPFYHGYRWLRGQAGMGLGDAKLLLLAGIWFGWQGALFALCAGAVQGTVFAIAVFLARGKLEEPEAVRQEREELQTELKALSAEERAQREKEIDDDVLLVEPSGGLRDARIAFGPFLILALLEFMLARELIEELFFWYLWQP